MDIVATGVSQINVTLVSFLEYLSRSTLTIQQLCEEVEFDVLNNEINVIIYRYK